MSRLVFFGRIYSTEQKVVDVHVVSNIALGDKGIQQGNANIVLKISAYDILLKVNADHEIDFDTAFKTAEYVTENYLNSLTLFSGQSYEFIFSSAMLSSGNFLPIVKSMPSKSDRLEEIAIDIRNIFVLDNTEIFRSLDELKNAINSFKDKGFHCFRAIEAIRRYFDRPKGGNDLNLKKVWDKFNGDLLIDGIGSTTIVTNFALTQRHGGFASMNYENAVSVLNFTVKVIVRFAFYLKHGGVPLKSSEFEILRYA